MQEATDLCSTNWTLVSLHSHDLTAIDTKAHMSTGKHDGVLAGRVTNNTFLLTLICNIGSTVVNSIDVIQVHNLVVVEEFLFQEFKPEIVGAIFLELAVSVLDISSSFASITLRINGLNGYNKWVKVISVAEKVLDSCSWGTIWTCVVFLSVYDAELTGELPLQTGTKFECL